MITPAYSATATERVLPRMALDFTTASLDGRVSITRALDTATAVNASGFIATVNANLPRFDYDPNTLACKGLLIEESRSNVCIQSADIDNVAWSCAGVSVVGDTIISPAGTTTGNTVTCSAGSSVHRVVGTAGVVVAATTITHSVFVKAGTYNFFQIHDGSTATFYANFNLTTGTVTAVNPANGATITPYGNGWYKCTFTLTAGTATSIGVVAIIPDGTSLRNPTWTAAGTESIYAWGYQIETGAFATSYIPTTTTSVTRNTDVVSMTGTNFSDWYNASEGTFTVFGDIPYATGSTRRLISINDGTANNSIQIANVSSALGAYFEMRQSSLIQVSTTNGSNLLGATTGYTFAYKENDCAVSSNAANPTTDAASLIPAVTQMEIGRHAAIFLNGHVSRVNFYPQRLTTNEARSFSK